VRSRASCGNRLDGRNDPLSNVEKPDELTSSFSINLRLVRPGSTLGSLPELAPVNWIKHNVTKVKLDDINE